MIEEVIKSIEVSLFFCLSKPYLIQRRNSHASVNLVNGRFMDFIVG